MSKNQAEASYPLSIFWLKKEGFLTRFDQERSGGISWFFADQRMARIDFVTNLRINAESSIRLIYTRYSALASEGWDMDYEIPLTTTPCTYGGHRYWFVCSLRLNGVRCGKRVGVLYSVGAYFGCRDCAKVAYKSQMRGGRYRGSSINASKIDRQWERVKRKYYNGRLTKKYKRAMDMERSLSLVFNCFTERMSEKKREAIENTENNAYNSINI